MTTNATAEIAADKKGHICPPSKATHPSGRWESLFVYGFICKFTELRGKVEGFDTPSDFEEALLSKEPSPIMTQILSRFVLNLRPGTRNLSSDLISSTVAGVLQEYFKSSERTVFWDEELKMNVDPFQGIEEGFFAASWDFKLKVLRQLVELQLSHSSDIKNVIDRAWGVIHNKHKKTEPASVPPPPGDPHSQEKLQLIPIGNDKDRKRYWVVDDSPRLYLSTNPWKITATFQTVASTREEYMATLDKIREAAPSEPKEGERRTKLEQAHLALLKALQDRVEAIDAELARIHRARRKIEQRNLLIAQAEVRETRTRRQTNRPDYAYMNDPISEDDQDEYKFEEQEDDEYEEQAGYDDLSGYRLGEPSTSSRRAAPPRRRSARTSNASSNGKRGGNEEWSEWRGERRSSRLGAVLDMQFTDPPPKRARTAESTTSTGSMDGAGDPPPRTGSGLKIKLNSGAAKVRPTETAVEVVAGKKKSKFWYYAVEPIPAPHGGVAALPPPSSDGVSLSSNGAESSTAINGMKNGGGSESSHTDADIDMYEKSIEGSLSPTSSMDES